MKLFELYLKQHRKSIWVFLLFVLTFAVSFLLYHIPVQAVVYPALLCFLIGAVFVIVDFGQAKKKHRQLVEIQRMTAAMIDQLPEVNGPDDQDYQTVISALIKEVAELETNTNIRYQDMVEYYTMWVHQIKTPIASMRLKLQSEDTDLSRKLSSDLFRIEQYVEMVLAFLRLDSTSRDYVIREHTIDEIIRPTVRKFASEFISRKIRLSYEPIVETIVTDEKWLCFVLEQVLSNALKYTREGSIKIYLEAPKTLCIEDTGIGIAPEDLPRIFEKGYTGYNGRSDNKASGIGLYLCKRICGKLAVGITVQSKVDKGTMVRLNLDQYQLRGE